MIQFLIVPDIPFQFKHVKLPPFETRLLTDNSSNKVHAKYVNLSQYLYDGKTDRLTVYRWVCLE